MTRILVAHRDADVAEDIRAMLRDMVGVCYEPATAPEPSHRAGVSVSIVTETPDLVVLDLDLPLDGHHPSEPRGGLALAGRLRQLLPNLPLIVLATSKDPALSEAVSAIPRTVLVSQGSGLEAELTCRVRDLLGVVPGRVIQPSARKRAPHFLIEFHLRADGDCTYRWRRVDEGGVEWGWPLPFTVEARNLKMLKKASDRLALSFDWPGDYQRIGDELRKIFLEGDLSVVKSIARLGERIERERPGAHASLCFVVDESHYPIALEALRNGEVRGDHYYWLERAPLWRQVALRDRRQKPLFEDPGTRDGPINCLIVEANAEGRVKELRASFESLPGVKEEADALASFLHGQATTKVGKIGRISQRASGVHVSLSTAGSPVPPLAQAGSFREVLQDLLAGDDPWHLVHFAGHSHYDIKHDWGYVVMPGRRTPGSRPAPPDYIGAPDFAAWLSRTRFIYMSSCMGSSQDFVFQLCKHDVPAVAGFRWPIEDKDAVAYSEAFYRALFARRSIEAAVHDTWLHLYGQHRGKSTWASSQLVMQAE